MFVVDSTGICRLMFLEEKVKEKLSNEKGQWIRLSGQDLKSPWLVFNCRSGKH